MAAYKVMWRSYGEWVKLLETDDPVEARNYALNNVCHSGITERIEVQDSSGCLETIYDCNWQIGE